MNIMSSCQRRRPLHSQSKGRVAIHMPWAMPMWRGLVQLLQLAAKEQDNNSDDKAMSTKQHYFFCDNRNGGDRNGNGNCNGNGNDTATAADANNVDD
jgi:hypothetical protein